MKLTDHELLEAAIIERNKDLYLNQYSTLLVTPNTTSREPVYYRWGSDADSAIKSDVELALLPVASPIGYIVASTAVYTTGRLTGYCNGQSAITDEECPHFSHVEVLYFIVFALLHIVITGFVAVLLMTFINGTFNFALAFHYFCDVSLLSNVVAGIWLLTCEVISLVRMFKYLKIARLRDDSLREG